MSAQGLSGVHETGKSSSAARSTSGQPPHPIPGFLLGIVWILEAFDIGIIGPFCSSFVISGTLISSTVGMVGSAGTFGIVLGLLPAARIADRYGRKTTLLVGIVIFSIFTFVTAFATNVRSSSLAGSSPASAKARSSRCHTCYSLEFVNKRWRGSAVGYANAVLGFSYGLNALAGALVIGHLAPETAWRVLRVLGGVPILMVPALLKFLPESPRFLLKAGKIETVRAYVERLEDLSGVPHDEQLIDPASLKVLEYSASRKLSMFDLFRPPYLPALPGRLHGAVSPFVTFYVITIYGPTIINRMGASPQDALITTSGPPIPHRDHNRDRGRLGRQDQPPLGLVAIMTITALGTITLGMP